MDMAPYRVLQAHVARERPHHPRIHDIEFTAGSPVELELSRLADRPETPLCEEIRC
jgi:hypothetical protein